MPYAPAVVERTMKVQEVLMQAISGKLTWLQAEEILGWPPRTLRRWRLRYRRLGYDGLWDRRRAQPSPRRAPVDEVARIARLYRERYAGFNAAHFHEIARREHSVTLGYTFVKRLLQTAGLLPKRRPRGRHRRRREPRPCFGELLHIEAVQVRLPRPARGHGRRVARIAEPPHPRPRALAQRHSPLHRRPHDPRQHRGLLRESIRRPRRGVAGLQPVAHQQPLHAGADPCQRRRHLRVARPRRRDETPARHRALR
jgi:transposase